MENVLRLIKNERNMQDRKWGEQNHHPFHWLTIIMEELGEASEAALDAYPHSKEIGEMEAEINLFKYKRELVQVAASAVAAIQCLDKQTGAVYIKEDYK